MQWNCPHCGIKLSAKDEAFGSGWSFSRCYKCAGFALVRRAEINVIKVDKAPPGENIILPEGSLNPKDGLISESATRNLARHMETPPKAAPTRMPPPPPSAQEKMAALATQVPAPVQAPTATPPQTFDFQIPDPLPDLGYEKKRKGLLPAGIVAASVLAIISGIYFYLQAQTLWERAKRPLPTAAAKEDEHASLSLPVSGVSIPPSQITAPAVEKEAPIAISPVITDQIQETATAPIKDKRQIAEEGEPEPSQNTVSNQMVVQVRAKRASIHNGPGMDFKVIGTVTADSKYAVVDWRDRWFKLQLQKLETSAKKPAAEKSNAFGWVRNDLVSVIPTSQPVASAGTASPNINPTH
ncbi:MAG: hypothetical protein HYX41_05525 [Bdellovibrio sp.]|nr:hypothetical protein [Bdellovibrio sp.]